jgi:hypothetical protein
VSYLFNRGGSKLNLFAIVKDIFDLLHDWKIRPLFQYISSADNFDADALSHQVSTSNNWCSSWQTRVSLFKHFGVPEIDLFADSMSHLLEDYFSFVTDERARCPKSTLG